jgi:hypothetical protein
LRLADPAIFDEPAVVALLERLPKPPRGLFTPKSSLYLRWRYGECPVRYYVLFEGEPPAALAVVRIRRRGKLTEAVLCELLVGEGALDSASALLSKITSACGADHVVALATGGGAASGALTSGKFRRIPRMGIEFVARPIEQQAGLERSIDPLDPANWVLSLGDVELL